MYLFYYVVPTAGHFLHFNPLRIQCYHRRCEQPLLQKKKSPDLGLWDDSESNIRRNYIRTDGLQPAWATACFSIITRVTIKAQGCARRGGMFFLFPPPSPTSKQ